MITLPSFFPVTCHTAFVGPGSIFVAISGFKTDGALYIAEAIDRGAHEIVVERSVVLTDIQQKLVHNNHIKLRRVDNARQALALLSAQYAGYPARSLKIIGITGTVGKTTTTYITAHLLRHVGYETAWMSSAKNCIKDTLFDPPLTTAQPDYLHQFLRVCCQEGVTHVVLEVAAQALSLHRVDTIEFDALVFTNFSRDHQEFYSTLDDYFAAKLLLVSKKKDSALCFINADDGWFSQKDIPHSCKLGIKNKADVQYAITSSDACCVQRLGTYFPCLSLKGLFNCYNMMLAIEVALFYGISPEHIQEGLNSFGGVPGRMQFIKLPNSAWGIVDYAYNPSCFKALFTTLRSMTDYLIVVFGCGGARDALKRPLMGLLAAEYADLIFLTSDNPRYEDPLVIIQDIIAGIPSALLHKVALCSADRKYAIEQAYRASRPGSYIAVLGKGPDEYQELQDVKTYFSDTGVLKKLQEVSQI